MYEQKSGLCTASLVLGIISIVTSLILNIGFLPGVLGLIFAIVCLATKKQPKGRAVGGLVTSIIGLVLGLFACLIEGPLIALIGFLGVSFVALIGLVGSAFNHISTGDINSISNMINNLSEYSGSYSGYDFDNFNWDDLYTEDYNWDDLYSDDYNWTDYYSDYDYDWNDSSYYDDSDYDWYSGSHEMTIENIYFEDLEQYGYTYSYGGSDYNVYVNSNGAEIEFPAYVYADYHDFGSTKYEAFDTFITMNGIKETAFYYDEKLYDDIPGVTEWEYAYTEISNEYGQYQIEIFAFNKNNNNLVCLLLRPSDQDPNGSNFNEDFNDFMNTMKYMHSTSSF